jgi:hypothetical protein
MFRGSVSFVAGIKGNGLSFSKIMFVPREAGIDQVEIEAPNGNEIRSTVHVSSVASAEDGRALAAKVNKVALDRIAFNHGIAIEDARKADDHFLPIDRQPGVLYASTGSYMIFANRASCTVATDAATFKKELEQPTQPGEQYYGLLRSARQSGSQVEEYMHLYNLLLMLHDDSQNDLDRFIVDQDPAVPRTQHPKKRVGVMESVYTRLRNEFAHKRDGADLATTKEEMVNRLGGLRELVRRAIELHV